MKILLEIPDNKAAFFLEVLKNFSFVKKATPLTDIKAQQLKDIREGIEEIKLIRQGKKKGRNAIDFINEL